MLLKDDQSVGKIEDWEYVAFDDNGKKVRVRKK